MLSDTCFDFSRKITDFVAEALDEMEDEINNCDEGYDEEKRAIRRAIAAFKSDYDTDPNCRLTSLAVLIDTLDKLRKLIDTAVSTVA